MLHWNFLAVADGMLCITSNYGYFNHSWQVNFVEKFINVFLCLYGLILNWQTAYSCLTLPKHNIITISMMYLEDCLQTEMSK